MQYSQEHLKTMVYAEFGGQTECIMGNWKIENGRMEFTMPNKEDITPISHFTVMDGSEAEACLDTNLPALLCKSSYSYAY